MIRRLKKASSGATKRASAPVAFGNVYGNGNQEWNSDNVDTSMGPKHVFTNPLHSPSVIESMRAELLEKDQTIEKLNERIRILEETVGKKEED